MTILWEGFWDSLFLYIPPWPWVHYPPASASQVVVFEQKHLLKATQSDPNFMKKPRFREKWSLPKDPAMPMCWCWAWRRVLDPRASLTQGVEPPGFSQPCRTPAFSHEELSGSSERNSLGETSIPSGSCASEQPMWMQLRRFSLWFSWGRWTLWELLLSPMTSRPTDKGQMLRDSQEEGSLWVLLWCRQNPGLLWGKLIFFKLSPSLSPSTENASPLTHPLKFWATGTRCGYIPLCACPRELCCKPHFLEWQGKVQLSSFVCSLGMLNSHQQCDQHFGHQAKGGQHLTISWAVLKIKMILKVRICYFF